MKTPTDENQIVRWLDGEMDAAERAAFESALVANSQLEAEVRSLRQLSDAIRGNIPAEREVPHADFFNSQIQGRIAREEQVRADTAAEANAGWLAWLRMPWLTAAAAALIALVSVSIWRTGGGSGASQVISSYAPNPEVQPRAFHSNDANATVLLLEGLPILPAEREVAGQRVHRSENDPQMAATTLFSERGEILMVVAKDSHDQPRLLERAN